MRERERYNESERGERDIRTDRQIDVQMTYVTPYFPLKIVLSGNDYN